MPKKVRLDLQKFRGTIDDMRQEFAQFRVRIMSILVFWPFLLSLALLITNDLYLKRAFPGWITGKLSDVAGIYLLTLLVTAASPKRKYTGAVILALGFLYWKSPLSQGLIDSVNSVFLAQIGRVVDYTDLLALIAIPLAWASVSTGLTRPRKFWRQRLLSFPIAAITMLALTGTSVLMPMGDYSIRNADLENRVSESAFVAAIERVTAKYGLQCENCDATIDEAIYFNDDMDFSYSLDEVSNGIQFRVRVTKMRGFILPNPDYDLFDRFLRDLKQELGKLSPSMEFVQGLSGPPYNY